MTVEETQEPVEREKDLSSPRPLRHRPKGGALMGDSTDPLEALAQIRRERQTTDAAERSWIIEARREGKSWEQIGEALGVTKQSAHERFAKIFD